MKKVQWLLVAFSALLYVVPFLFSEHLWWLIFIFPVPLLYVGCIGDIAFIHGYMWGCLVFVLHFSGGIYVMASMAHERWVVGIVLGSAVVLYQAFFCGIYFWVAAYLIRAFFIKKLIFRLWVWTLLLWLLIIWIDGYSMWIFGAQEGYPLMHPLFLLAKKPMLLCLLPVIGKQPLTILFLLIPMSIVVLGVYKNYRALLFFGFIIGVWLLFLLWPQQPLHKAFWHKRIKSLPCMVCSTAKNPLIPLKIIGSQVKKIVRAYPKTEIIIMPESACNIDNFADLSDLLCMWDECNIGKPIHLIFGACRWHEGNYYNSLHWVYNGILQDCFDKRHGMLISERLPLWIDNHYVHTIYFPITSPITVSCCSRKKINIGDMTFVPYICSELFCNKSPDDSYGNSPIIAIINDSLFLGSAYSLYIQKLLLLLACFKAVQWQRDIVYVSYAHSLFIDKYGTIKEIDH